MALDRTVYDKALKEFYIPPLRDEVNRATVSLDRFERRQEKVEGRNYIIPMISRKHAGVVSRSGATKSANKLPTAQTQEYVVSTWAMKYHYGRIEIDGPTMRSSKTDRGSFARAMDTEMKGIQMSLPQDLNRQIFGDGTNTLALPSTAGASATVCAVDSTKFLETDMYITFIGTPSGAFGAKDTAQISSIDSSTQITLTAVSTWATSDPIVSESDGTATANPYRNAMTGLNALVYDGNITNMNTTYVGLISRASTIMYWAANRLHNSAALRPVSIGLLQQGMLKSGTRKFGGNIPTIALTNADIWATIGNLLVSDKRFRGDVMKLDGGWQYLDFSGVPIVWDKDAPDEKLFFLDEAHIFFLQQEDISWMDEDGGILHRVTDYDSYEAVLYTDLELATDRPAAHTVLEDLDTNLS